MRIFLPLFVLLLALVVTAGTVHALSSLSGSATLGLQGYQGESAGVEEKATSFYQQYSVTFERRGLLYDGRIGAYTLMAGYEINVIDPTLVRNGVRDAEVDDITTSKPVYTGSLVLAPGGLPFRLTLFAGDTKRSSFRANNDYALFNTGYQNRLGSSTSGHLILPDILNDLSNGTSRTLGATLLVGIRNGSYLGSYRDSLSQLPRLLVDFKQEDVKDLHNSFSQTNYRIRNLAFVSLNKKDNWVHLRMKDFTDFLDPRNDTRTQQVMIGTVDHVLARQWINLTNWIKLSGDLSYTVEKKVDTDQTGTYTINMMSILQRQNIVSSLFSRFSRENNGSTIISETDIPLHVVINFSRDTLLRSNFIYESDDTTIVEGRQSSESDRWLTSHGKKEVYLDTQLELARSRPIVVKSRLEMASLSGDDTADALALSLGAEVSSNNKLNKAFSWLGGYKLTAAQRNNSLTGENDTYLQNDIYGWFEKDFSRTLRAGGRAALKNGVGGAREDGTRIETMSAGLSRMPSSNNEKSVGDEYDGMASYTSFNLYLDHRFQQFGNRLDVDFEIFLSDVVSDQRTSLGHTFTFEALMHRIDWKTQLIIGDTPEAPRSVDFEYVGTSTAVTDNSTTWDTEVKYFYTPSRSVGFNLLGSMTGRDADINYKISQELLYRIFTRNGIVRRIAEFSEEFGYEYANETLDTRGVSLYTRLLASYFPRKWLYGKLRSETVFLVESGALQQLQGVELGFNFEKLNILASYIKGQKDRESEDLPAVAEQRWEVKVQKLF